MLLIPTEIKPSPIQGLGLFTSGYLRKGQKVWELHYGLDVVMSNDDLINALSHVSNTSRFEIGRWWSTYGYRIRKDNPGVPHLAGYWVLCSDGARYMNHSDDPNCDSDELVTVANRDVPAGVELTVNYKHFCDDWEIDV